MSLRRAPVYLYETEKQELLTRCPARSKMVEKTGETSLGHCEPSALMSSRFYEVRLGLIRLG